MTNLYDQLVGIPWYRPERYHEARSRMTDAALIPASYNVWRQGAEKREHDTRSAGATPKRIYVDDDRFVIYCTARNLTLDSKARARYAADFCASTFKANVTDYANPGFRHGAIRGR